MNQLEQPSSTNSSTPGEVFERLMQALNRHDLEGMVGCFADDFRSEQPLHPERAFTGPAGVRKNWSFFFSMVPDIRVEVLRQAVDGETLWAEVHNFGTQVDGNKFSIKGVHILGIKKGLISWGRIYMEPVQENL